MSAAAIESIVRSALRAGHCEWRLNGVFTLPGTFSLTPQQFCSLLLLAARLKATGVLKQLGR